MLTEARERVAGILGSVGVPVHAYPPQTVSPPAVMILPGATYRRGYALNGSGTVGLSVQIVTQIGGARHMDELIVTVCAALVADGWISCGPVPAPIVDIDTGMLITRIPVEL